MQRERLNLLHKHSTAHRRARAQHPSGSLTVAFTNNLNLAHLRRRIHIKLELTVLFPGLKWVAF